MRMRQKVNGKQYSIYARRNRKEKWTDWTSVNSLEKAFDHFKSIQELGYKARIFDRLEKTVVKQDD